MSALALIGSLLVLQTLILQVPVFRGAAVSRPNAVRAPSVNVSGATCARNRRRLRPTLPAVSAKLSGGKRGAARTRPAPGKRPGRPSKDQPSPSPSPFTAPETLQILYAGAAATIALAGAAVVLDPSLVTSQLAAFEGPQVVTLDQVRTGAVFSTPLAACEAALLASAAGDPERFASNTYERIELGLFLCSAAGLAHCAFGFASGAVSAELFAITAAGALPLAAATAASLGGRGASPQLLFEGSLAGARRGFDVGGASTVLGKYLASQVVLTLVVGGSFAFSPMSPLAVDEQLFAGGGEPAALHFNRTNIGLSFLLLYGPVLSLLQDAEERANLRQAPFRALCVASGVALLGLDVLTVYSALNIANAAAEVGKVTDLNLDQLPTFVSAISIAFAQLAIFFYLGLRPSFFGEDEDEEVVARDSPS